MVRWGVLGTAQIARACVIPAILKAENSALHAVASRDRRKAEALLENHQSGRAYAGYEALLADPQVEAIYIPLPNHLHRQWTLRALEAGKHVLVEKPISMSAGEAEEMADAARRHERLLMEGFMYRFHPRSLQIRQLVREGALGHIGLIRSAFTFPVQRDGSNERLFSMEMGGGSLWDVGCYGVSLARWLLAEEPISACGQAVYGESGVDLSFVGTLRFASGALASIESAFTSALQQTYAVLGDLGAIELPHDAFIPWEQATTFVHRRAEEESGQVIEVGGADEYQRMIEHFADAVTGAAPLAYAPEDSVAQMRVMDALARSAQRGERVTLD